MGRRAAVAALMSLVLAACTGDPVAAPTPSPSPPSSTTPTSPRPTIEREHQPLVLVTHMTRPAVSLDLETARAVLRGRVDRWRVVAAPGSPVSGVRVAPSAAAAVRTVERDPGALAVVPAAAVGPTVRAVVVDGVDPIRDPADYPLTTEGPAPPGRTTTLSVVGDIMLSRGVTDPAAALEPLSPRLSRADVTVGNLESTLSTEGEPQQGDDSFGAPPSVVRLLAGAGFDVLSLANNHTGDFGERALLQTVRRLRRSPIRPFGAGRDLAGAGRAAVVERDGVRFGFVGFNAIGETPRATRNESGALSIRMPPRTGPLQGSDLTHVAGLVRELDRRVDVVVVLPHWGTQYTHTPEAVQRLVARRLVDAGADLVVGGHPHWVQGLDVHQSTVIAHSLGNFVFDMDTTQTQQGVVLEATYWGDRLMAIDLVPYRMDAGHAPRLASSGESAQILADVWSTSTGPFSAG